MEIGTSSYGLSLLAGVLTILSPCVLPLIPILFGSAVGAHRFGSFALVGGLMLSFTLVGVALGALGGLAGVDAETLRIAGGVLLLLFGLVLVSDPLQIHFLALMNRLGPGQGMLAKFNPDGLSGQFMLGMLLGIVWTPCVGPTLGVAITLASQGQALAQVAAVMLVFSLGAAMPLLAIGAMSRQALGKWRHRMLETGQAGKKIFGIALLLIGMLVLTGADKYFEKWALNAMPDWLATLTSRY
ncbi:MAG: cytochrome c biogenesis protein CcdA [Gallionella sp.]|nr:cytochrome c biogenesis protein CcdA [Gallionella sp.]